MPDLFFGIPAGSVAVRAAVGVAMAIAVSRLLLTYGLRSPRVRVAAAVMPLAVLLGMAAASASNPQLPQLWTGYEGQGLAVRFGENYRDFAPVAVQVLIAVWAAVATLRISRRIWTWQTATAQLNALRELAPASPAHVRERVRTRAAELGVAPPAVAVVADCPGSAALIGLSDAVLMLDATLVATCDEQELDGIIAHELAHLKRRDNLTQLVLGFVSDVFFFIPGAGWAVRRMSTERELAADQLAATTTGAPAALASGLLAAMQLGPSRATACAHLVGRQARASVPGRVRALLEPPRSGRARATEAATLVTAGILATAIGWAGPLAAAGDWDGVSLVWAPTHESPAAMSASVAALQMPQSSVFRSWRSSDSPEEPLQATSITSIDAAEIFRSSTLAACRNASDAACTPDVTHQLGLERSPAARLDRLVASQWHSTPVIVSERGLAVYLLRSLVPAGN